MSVDAGDLTRTSTADLLKEIYGCPVYFKCGPCERRISELAVRASRLDDAVILTRDEAERIRGTLVAADLRPDHVALLDSRLAEISKDAGPDTSTEKGKSVAGVDPPAPQDPQVERDEIQHRVWDDE